MLAMRMMRDVSGYPAGSSAALIRVGIHDRANHSSLDPDHPLRVAVRVASGRGSLPGRRRARVPDGGFADGRDSCRRPHARPAQGRSDPDPQAAASPWPGPDPDDAASRAAGRALLGVFTPTEAAAVAAIYAIALGAFVYRNLGPKTLMAVMLESAPQSEPNA